MFSKSDITALFYIYYGKILNEVLLFKINWGVFLDHVLEAEDVETNVGWKLSNSPGKGKLILFIILVC